MYPQQCSSLNGSFSKNIISLYRMKIHLVKHFCLQGLFTLLLSAAASSVVMASPFNLPAIAEPASQEHHVGKVIFVELATPDLAATKKFYAGLFDWTFQDYKDVGIDYAVAFLDGHPVAGLVHRDKSVAEHRHPRWLSFISVRDADKAKEIALQLGAKVLFEPRNIPDLGREAAFEDPQGAIFAVLASSSGDPPDILVSPGEWIWSSLITIDPDIDAAFYQKLFDYEVFAMADDDVGQHLLLASDNYARSSVNTMPAGKPKSHPQWINYIHVEDAVKMTARVVELGGRVLVEPRLDRHGGKVAIVADPLGAPFGLLEWPDNGNKEVAE
jgi:hypothetical protein